MPTLVGHTTKTANLFMLVAVTTMAGIGIEYEKM